MPQHNEFNFKLGFDEGRKDKLVQDLKNARISKVKRTKKVPEYESNADIFLTNLRKHLKNLQKQRKNERMKGAREYIKFVKKQEFVHKDMQNPQYKVINRFRFTIFKDQILPRSVDGRMTSGKAWRNLKNCWIGFKKAYNLNDIDNMKFYGYGIQKHLWLLEEIPIDFEHIGLKPYKSFI